MKQGATERRPPPPQGETAPNMGIDAKQLRSLIRRTLQQAGMHSEAAEALLMGTAAQESHLGQYLRQVGGGPALGIFQMEPATAKDIWINYMAHKRAVWDTVLELSGVVAPSELHLEANLVYQILLARVHYMRVTAPLPDVEPAALGAYWKRHWNTPKGAGTVEQFIENWNRFCA